MTGYLMKKITGLALVLFGASFLTYAMILLAPGDAAREIAVARYGGESQLDGATVEWIREKRGLTSLFLSSTAGGSPVLCPWISGIHWWRRLRSST